MNVSIKKTRGFLGTEAEIRSRYDIVLIVKCNNARYDIQRFCLRPQGFYVVHPEALASTGPFSSPSIRYRPHKHENFRLYCIPNTTQWYCQPTLTLPSTAPPLLLLCICSYDYSSFFCAVCQTVKAAARTVTLSAEASLVASAVATGTAFDLRSLKPGMLVDTMVDSVVSNGMLVSHHE